MPKFSIVIPTQNRADTLYYTLKTCLNQYSFDDYEVIVSDNCSTDNTAEMVKEFNSEKIKYYKTDSYLCMMDSWNFAMSKTTGEYVLFLGSDDALHSYGLYFLDRIISITGEKVIDFVSSDYYWPDDKITYHENLFTLHNVGGGTTIIDAKENVKKIVADRVYAQIGPWIYHGGVVHKNLINEIIDKAGAAFNGIGTDTSFALALSSIIDYFIKINIPVCCIGLSKTSGRKAVIGKARVSTHHYCKKDLYALKGKFYAADILSPIEYTLIDDFSDIKSKLNAFSDIDVNISELIRKVISECYNFNKYLGNKGKAYFEEDLAIIKEVIENNPEYKASYLGGSLNIDDYEFYDPIHLRFPPINNGSLKFDVSSFGIDNIFDAVLFAEKLFLNIEFIDAYLAEFERDWNKLKNMFARLKKYKRLGIFAVGKHTEHFLKLYQFYRKDVDIVLFDNDKAKCGTLFCGHKVFSPETIPSQNIEALIISSNKFQNEIYESLKKYDQVTEIIKLYEKPSESFIYHFRSMY
jgi:glycosyltransferase involved in cell wall biosynthesis